MRENKLIKITENIKKNFAKLSEAKDLGEFLQILRDLGYTGNAKDLELDLFEILQNLSNEELRIVSGGTKSIKNKIGAGILGELIALSGVSFIMATDNDIVTELPIHDSDWNEDEELDFETDPEELLLPEHEDADNEKPDEKPDETNGSGDSSDFIPENDDESEYESDNSASTNPYSENNRQFMDVESDTNITIPKNPSTGKEMLTTTKSIPLHKKINYGDLGGFLSLATSFVGGGLIDRYVYYVKTNTKPTRAENVSREKPRYNAMSPELNKCIHTLAGNLNLLLRAYPDLPDDVVANIQKLLDLYIRAAILDENYIMAKKDSDTESYHKNAEQVYKDFAALIISTSQNQPYSKAVNALYAFEQDRWNATWGNGVKTDKVYTAVNLMHEGQLAITTNINGQYMYHYVMTAGNPQTGAVLKALVNPTIALFNFQYVKREICPVGGIPPQIKSFLDSVYWLLNAGLDNLREGRSSPK